MEKKMTKVVINSMHQLMEDQERVLNEKFGTDWKLFPVPEEGWTLAKMREIAHSLNGEDVVFASPIPALLKILATASGAWNVFAGSSVNHRVSETNVGNTWVLHNDRRDAKEISLPNGKTKVIHTVAKTGWELV